MGSSPTERTIKIELNKMSVITTEPEVSETVKSTLDINNSTVDIEEYKGRPTFVINKHSRYPFSFQLPKAKLLVKYMKELQRFVETNGASLN